MASNTMAQYHDAESAAEEPMFKLIMFYHKWNWIWVW